MANLFESNFRERFCTLLEEKKADGVDQQTIADALKVSKQTLTSWKTGVRSPRRPMLLQIAAYFRVSPLWLEGIRSERDNYGGEQMYQATLEQIANEALMNRLSESPEKERLVQLIADAGEKQIDMLSRIISAVLGEKK